MISARSTLILLMLASLALPVCPAGAQAPRAGPRETLDAKLQNQLQELVRDFRGRVGLYVRHLPTGRISAINADELFPTASMIKVPILIGLFDAIDRGVLGFRSDLVYRDSLLYPGEDLLGSFRDGARISVSKLVLLMISASDNTAALWAQDLAGGGTAINQWLDRNGFVTTRVNSRTPGRERNRTEHGWGQTTPREMANLLVMIREGRAVSPAASEEMYRALGRVYWTGEAVSTIPPTVQVAAKQGAVDDSRSEVGLVSSPSGDYVFCIITKGQADQSWTSSNEGFVLLRRISAALWQHFEPKNQWVPARGVERFKP